MTLSWRAGIYRTKWACPLKAIERQLVEVQKRLDKLFDIVERGTLNEMDVANRIKQQRATQEKLSKARNSVLLGQDDEVLPMDAKMIRAHVVDLKQMIASGDKTEKKNLIKSFVKRVIVDLPTLRVEYRIPDTREEKPREGEVLPFIQSGQPAQV